MITNPPTGTMTLARVERAALDIADTIMRSTNHQPSPEQVARLVENYCDDPATNATDRARIRVRVEQHIEHMPPRP